MLQLGCGRCRAGDDERVEGGQGALLIERWWRKNKLSWERR